MINGKKVVMRKNSEHENHCWNNCFIGGETKVDQSQDVCCQKDLSSLTKKVEKNLDLITGRKALVPSRLVLQLFWQNSFQLVENCWRHPVALSKDLVVHIFFEPTRKKLKLMETFLLHPIAHQQKVRIIISKLPSGVSFLSTCQHKSTRLVDCSNYF